MDELCRTCGESANSIVAENLYEDPQLILVQQIKSLTGLTLANELGMPEYICKSCENHLHSAMAFRQKCIKTEESLKQFRIQNALLAKDDGNILMCADYFESFMDIIEEEANEDILNEPLGDIKNLVEDLIDSESTGNLSHETLCVNINKPNSTVDVVSSNTNTNQSKTNSLSRYEVNDLKNETKKRRNWKLLNEEETIAMKRERRRRECVCDQCGKYFSCPSNFKIHILRHSGNKEFQCSVCGSAFYTQHLLNLHRKITHLGERPYECKDCGKSFRHCAQRTIHERTHTHERPFKCEQCEKCFYSAKRLRSHKISHSDERPYHCDICGHSFQRLGSLKQHYRSQFHQRTAESLSKRKGV